MPRRERRREFRRDLGRARRGALAAGAIGVRPELRLELGVGQRICAVRDAVAGITGLRLRDLALLHGLDLGLAHAIDEAVERRLVALPLGAGLGALGLDAAGSSHHRAQDDLRPCAVGEPVDAERLGIGELAALPMQLAACRLRVDPQHALEHAVLLEAREQVADQMGFDTHGLALGLIERILLLHEPRLARARIDDLLGARLGERRIERHRDVVDAGVVEHDVAQHLEALAHLLVAMDLAEPRQDLDHRAALGGAHARHHATEPVDRPAHRDQQQAEIDEHGDRERNVVALGQARLRIGGSGKPGGGLRVLDRLDRLLLQLALLVGRRRHLQGQDAGEGGGQPAKRLDRRFRALDGGDLRLFDVRQAVDGAHDALQRAGELCIRALVGAALGIGERGLVGALGQIGADLLQLRIGAERIEAGHRVVELAAQRLHELVAGAGLGIDDRLVVLGDFHQVGVERGDIGLDLGRAALDEIAGEREAGRVVLAHLAARAVAGLGGGAGGAGGALVLGLALRDLGE